MRKCNNYDTFLSNIYLVPLGSVIKMNKINMKRKNVGTLANTHTHTRTLPSSSSLNNRLS